MVKALVFDFGKVLVDYDFKRYVSSIVPDEKHDRFYSCVMTDEWFMTFDKEDVPFEETIKKMQSLYPDLVDEIQVFADNFSSIVLGEMPGMKDLLTRLKAEGYILYGLTNWCHKVHETMSQFGIFDLLDGQVISSEVHEIKPFPQIYNILLDKLGLKPEECIFTDDRQVNIDGAAAVGIRGILFKDSAQFETELRAILQP